MTFSLDMRGESDQPVYGMHENMLVGANFAIRQHTGLKELHREALLELAGLTGASVRDIKHWVEKRIGVDRLGRGHAAADPQ